MGASRNSKTGNRWGASDRECRPPKRLVAPEREAARQACVRRFRETDKSIKAPEAGDRWDGWVHRVEPLFVGYLPWLIIIPPRGPRPSQVAGRFQGMALTWSDSGRVSVAQPPKPREPTNTKNNAKSRENVRITFS